MARFNLEKFIGDVFAPVSTDVITFMVDMPHDNVTDNANWLKRRSMAEEWRQVFDKYSKKVGCKVNKMVQYMATGGDGVPLPERAMMDGKDADMENLIAGSTLILAMTEFSASAPLILYTNKYTTLRVASMPHLLKEMEETALSADYGEVAKMCDRLLSVLQGAVGAKVVFSTGHSCYFDLRHRGARLDNGQLWSTKKESRLINLPSGEVYITPYEGEIEGEPSKTEGELASSVDNEVVIYKVKNNRIVEVEGGNKEIVKNVNDYFKVDEFRRNIAEFGLGCNSKAIRRNNILEDEKAGFHWAYGRSDHIGGTVGVKSFKKPENITHTDLIYAKGSKVTVNSISIQYADGSARDIWDGNWYTV